MLTIACACVMAVRKCCRHNGNVSDVVDNTMVRVPTQRLSERRLLVCRGCGCEQGHYKPQNPGMQKGWRNGRGCCDRQPSHQLDGGSRPPPEDHQGECSYKRSPLVVVGLLLIVILVTVTTTVGIAIEFHVCDSDIIVENK